MQQFALESPFRCLNVTKNVTEFERTVVNPERVTFQHWNFPKLGKPELVKCHYRG